MADNAGRLRDNTVGPRLVGHGRVGRGPVGEAVNFLNQNVVQPVGQALSQAQRAAQEQMRTTVSSSQPLDGFMGVHGVTRHRVWFMDGGQGIYNPQGQLVTTEAGNPPSRINSTLLYLGGVGGGGGQIIPGRAAPGGPAVPRIAPRFAPI